MRVLIPDGWWIFCGLFGVLGAAALLMQLLSRNFYTFKVITRKFSSTDLAFPANGEEISGIIKGMYCLQEGSEKAIRSLRLQLIIDFIFMPAAYGSIFLMCMMFSHKMPAGGNAFALIAWLQIISFCADVIENIYLLRNIKPDAAAQGKVFFTVYKWLELLKRGIALFGMVCGLSAGLYFWLSGHYLSESLIYVSILGLELLMLLILLFVFRKNSFP